MKCPYCLVEINPAFKELYLGQDKGAESWSVLNMNCPNPTCSKLIVELASGNVKTNYNGDFAGVANISQRFLVKPLGSSRQPIPSEVDKQFADDYIEACLVIPFSQKASAALSRRCLQNILREKGGIKKNNLTKEIQQVIDSNSLPSYLAESIDAIRNIGNFGAHPLKSTSTSEIVDVEEGEAEWLLDILESLFDFYFVQPAILQAKRDALNAKLAEIGKPPIK